MFHYRFLSDRLAFLSVLFLSTLLSFSATAPTALSAGEIIKKTIARAQATQGANTRSNYSYIKRAVTEELDNNGTVKDKKEKLFFFKSGYGYLQQVKVNGAALSGAELKKQEESILKDSSQVTSSKTGKRDDNWERFLTPELVAKYQFTLVERAEVNGRPTYVLSFQPLSNLPVKHISDRLANQIFGKVWIDEREFEIARAEIGLQSEVSLWGGVLGALKKFSYTLVRTRVDENVWFNSLTHGDFVGRKLLDSTHVKLRSESSNFKRLLPATPLLR